MPAKSVAQQRMMAMVHNCQKTGKCASSEVKKIAGSISDKDAEDFASTKHKGLPEKKEKKHESFEEYMKKQDKMITEVGTSTACVAMFKQPLTEPVRRKYPIEDKKKK